LKKGKNGSVIDRNLSNFFAALVGMAELLISQKSNYCRYLGTSAETIAKPNGKLRKI
jgi:hypothetical protein